MKNIESSIESCLPYCTKKLSECRDKCKIHFINEELTSESDLTCLKKCLDNYKLCKTACG